jgi:glycosyltransferase involved in cell wall biosynthesis
MAINNVGIVIIGRNEGERLIRCINSANRETHAVVYVDSGSTDNSIEQAAQLGALTVILDLTIPFTAARARNAGFERLITHFPTLDYVQFIDGDCELIENWIQQGLAFLNLHPIHAIVCGRRKERFPNASIYNMLCDIEWNTPIGEATACGGDALIRINALKQVNGYRDDLIAGEEPEMCFRLRARGWKIFRLDAEMTWHDAAMTKYKQWWQRSKRAGYAYAEGSSLHGNSEEKYWLKETRSILFWGCFLPTTLLILSFTFNSAFLFGGLIYIIQVIKIAHLHPVDPNSRKISLLYSFYIVLGKFPQFVGLFRYAYLKFLSRPSKLIEYK